LLLPAMENTSLSSDFWNNITTSSSTDDDLTQYVAHISNRAVKVTYIIIGTIGIIDNLFVIVIFALFIKITDKVLAIFNNYYTIILSVVPTDLLFCYSSIQSLPSPPQKKTHPLH